MYSTTINLYKPVALRLEEVANNLKISRKKLIFQILNFALKNLNSHNKYSGTTRYQHYSDNQKWSNIHIRVNNDEIKLLHSCRFFFHISVSKLISVCWFFYITKYFNKKPNKNNGRVYSYSHFIPKTIIPELNMLFIIKKE